MVRYRGCSGVPTGVLDGIPCRNPAVVALAAAARCTLLIEPIESILLEHVFPNSCDYDALISEAMIPTTELVAMVAGGARGEPG